jgi:cob(I)alamin adenosyltransferase
LAKGRLYVFTGNGKGKTTAALGMAIRAAGADKRVFIAQFAKKGHYSEIEALNRLSDSITVEQFGTGSFVGKQPRSIDYEAAAKGLERVKQVMAGNDYQMVIMDEAAVVVKLGLLAVDDLYEVAVNRPKGMDLIITGRYAPDRIIKQADFATEMKARRHYFEKGVRARIGIEK